MYTKDEVYHQRCLELAQSGLGRVSPNPMVGSVIVFDGKIIGEGYHKEFGGSHAEVNAINSVQDKELLSKSTRNYYKGEKFTLYRDIDSLKEYILIDTEKIYIEKHIRHADNSWQLTDYRLLENSFTIDTVQIILSLKDIYEGVYFE